MKVIPKDTDNIIDERNKYLLESELINEHLPCDKCDGDCCGPVPFNLTKLLFIFDKYSKNKKFNKRFPWNEQTVKKNMIFIQAFPNDNNNVMAFFKTHGQYLKNNLKGKDSCIFKDNEITGGCLIYEDRPIICKEYGRRKLLKCPYSGLQEQPKDEEVKKGLVRLGFEARNNTLLNTFNVNSNFFVDKKLNILNNVNNVNK